VSGPRVSGPRVGGPRVGGPRVGGPRVGGAGIWRHADLLDPATVQAAREGGWSLGEGDTPLTPLPSLAASWGLGSLRLKREDWNPGGSHKDRGVLYQVAHHRAADKPTTFVVSSSGNAAISAAAACRVTGGRLLAFVSTDTAPGKLRSLLASDAFVIASPKPKNFARYAARVFGLQNLRATLDDTASIGYRSLGAELAEAGPVDAVLTFSTSGASLRGLAEGLERREHAAALWAVQAGTCLGIARAAGDTSPEDPDCPAGQLGTREPPGAAELAARLLRSGGGATVVGTAAILELDRLLHDAGVETSAEGCAVVAAVRQLQAALRGRHVVAVLTGHGSQWDRPGSPPPGAEVRRPATEALRRPLAADSYLEVRSLLESLGLEPTP
jgi:threonine synthase